MAVDALKRHGHVGIGRPFQIALRGGGVKDVDRSNERRAVTRVFGVLQHHPPGIVGQVFQCPTVCFKADPITDHHRFEDLLGVLQLFAHDAVQLWALSQARARTRLEPDDGSEHDEREPFREPFPVHLETHSLCRTSGAPAPARRPKYCQCNSASTLHGR